jgi:hypothetical protein
MLGVDRLHGQGLEDDLARTQGRRLLSEVPGGQGLQEDQRLSCRPSGDRPERARADGHRTAAADGVESNVP